MEVLLEHVKLLDDVLELMTHETKALMEADLNFFEDLVENGPERPCLPFDRQLDALGDKIFESVGPEAAKAIDKLVEFKREVISSEDLGKVDAAFFAGWLFGSGQRGIALKVIEALPATTEAGLHRSLDQLIEGFDQQVKDLPEVSSVVPLGVVPDDGEA